MSFKKSNILPNSKEEFYGFEAMIFKEWNYGIKYNFPIWITFVQSAKLKEGAFFKHHRPNQYAVEIVESGSLKITIDDENFEIFAGELIILPAGTPNILKIGNRGCTKWSFGITGNLLNLLLTSLHIKTSEIYKLKNIEIIKTILLEIISIYKEKDETKITTLFGLNNQLLMEIKLQIENLIELNPTLEKAVRILDANSNSTIKTEDIAKELGISYVTLYNLFKTHLNISPKNYLTKIKMNNAANYLLNSQLNIKEISFLCGYKNPIIFTREFQKYFSCSPRDYKKIRIDL